MNRGHRPSDRCYTWEVGPRQLKGSGVDNILLRRTEAVGEHGAS